MEAQQILLLSETQWGLFFFLVCSPGETSVLLDPGFFQLQGPWVANSSSFHCWVLTLPFLPTSDNTTPRDTRLVSTLWSLTTPTASFCHVTSYAQVLGTKMCASLGDVGKELQTTKASKESDQIKSCYSNVSQTTLYPRLFHHLWPVHCQTWENEGWGFCFIETGLLRCFRCNTSIHRTCFVWRVLARSWS